MTLIGICGETLTLRQKNCAEKLDCKIGRLLCWTDNLSTLHWIWGSPSRWKPFVANRVTEIQALLDTFVWRYFPGPENPADLPLRGMSAKELKESKLWWEGPTWLRSPEDKWPINLRSAPCLQNVDAERKRQEATRIYVVQLQGPFIDFARFSMYNKLLRAIAWMKKFIYNARVKPSKRKPDVLNGAEIQEAEQWLIH